MTEIMIESLIGLPQFGLNKGEIGPVEEELVTGHIARGFAARVQAPAKGKAKPAPTPAVEVVDE